ncbi:MAG: hypothetical protein H8D46_00020, partial [FCB group bacterium]|nr:hypothetical protein [FCB group bacterium]
MKSNIKHLKSLLLFIILSILVLQCTDDNDRDNYGVNSSLDDIDFDFQWLSTSGNMIVDEDGNQVILHGVNRSGFEYNYTGNGQRSLEYSIIIEDWHAKIVRL